MGQKNTKQRDSMQSNLKANCLEISQKCDLPLSDDFFSLALFFDCLSLKLSRLFSLLLKNSVYRVGRIDTI